MSNRNIFDSLDNDVEEEDEKVEKQYTQEREETANITTVKTTISNPEIDNEDLSENIIAEQIPTNNILYSCYQCNKTKVLLLPVITEESERGYCCMNCISNKMIDSCFNQFLHNSRDYEGSFYNYKDRQKA